MATWKKYAAMRRYDHKRAGDVLTRADRGDAGKQQWSIGGTITTRRTWRSGDTFYTIHAYGVQLMGKRNIVTNIIETVSPA